MTNSNDEPFWILTYTYQSCYDDGGLGHDVTHSKSHYDFRARDVNEAREKAKIFISEHTGKWPCKSGCGNVGAYWADKLEHIVPEVRTQIALQERKVKT